MFYLLWPAECRPTVQPYKSVADVTSWTEESAADLWYEQLPLVHNIVHSDTLLKAIEEN